MKRTVDSTEIHRCPDVEAPGGARRGSLDGLLAAHGQGGISQATVDVHLL